MSKRFRDTAIWNKPWFRRLSCADKAAWAYICDSCDAVGVWDADTEAADFIIGEKIDWPALVDKCNGNIEILENGKWWLVDFCSFQYGTVHCESNSKVQQNLYNLLLRHGLWHRVAPTVAPTVQDKEKEKEKEKDKEKEDYACNVRMKPADYRELCNKYGAGLIDLAIQKVSAQQIKTGKLYPHPKGAILQWGIRAAEEELQRNKGKGVKDTRASTPTPLCRTCGKDTVWTGSERGLCMACERRAIDADTSATVDDTGGNVGDGGMRPEDVF